MKRIAFTTKDYVFVQDSETFKLKKLRWVEFNKIKNKVASGKPHWHFKSNNFNIEERKDFIKITLKSGKVLEIYKSISGICCNGEIISSVLYPIKLCYLNSKNIIRVVLKGGIGAVDVYPNGSVYLVNRYSGKRL